MLPVEDQVCSLEDAKRLQELGINQHSLFYFVKDQFTQLPMMECNPDKFIIRSKPFITSKPDNFYSAFTVAELLEILPLSIEENHLTIFAHSELDDKSKYWKIGYVNCLGIYVHFTHAFKLAYAISEMLIYLIETKRITAEEINKCPG